MASSKLRASAYPTLGSGAVFSSLTGTLKNHLLNRFPKGFFKYVYIRNGLVSITEDGLDQETELVKNRPSFSMLLNYQFNEASFDGDSVRWGLSMIPKRAWERDPIYKKLLINEVDSIYVVASETRTKLTYELAARVDSETQAANLVAYIRHYIGIDRPYYLQNVVLEQPIPADVVKLVASAIQADQSTPAGREQLRSYISKWSGGRVSFKKNLSSGNFVFFARYNCNVLCRIDDQPQTDVVRENKAIIEATVRWNMSVEFPTFTNFITEYEMKEGINEDSSGVLDTGAAVYNYSSFRLLFDRQRGDLSLNTSFEFVTEPNVSVDVTPFGDALKNDVLRYIDHVVKGGYQGTALELIVAVDDNLLDKSLYEVDWEKLEMKLLNPLQNYVHRIAVYLDARDYASFTDAYYARPEAGAPGSVKEIQDPAP
jgi:hypothetical protein